MRMLNIAATEEAKAYFHSFRKVIPLEQPSLTEASAAVMTTTEAKNGLVSIVEESGFDIPLVLVKDGKTTIPESLTGHVTEVLDTNVTDLEYNGRRIDSVAQRYEDHVLPPFFARTSPKSSQPTQAASDPREGLQQAAGCRKISLRGKRRGGASP